MKKANWITLFLVVAAGTIALLTLDVQRENRGVHLKPYPGVAHREPEHMAGASSTSGERTTVLPQPGLPPKTEPAQPVISSVQPFAHPFLGLDLDDVAASFVTELPRVTDLLGLIEEFAWLAVVDRDSVTVQRSQDGDQMNARGSLAVDDLPGAFQIDEDGFRIEFVRPLADGPWSQCRFQITFEDGESGARGCYANVTFHPREGEDLARHQDEVLVGWAVGTTPEIGAIALPLTMTREGNAWRNGGEGRLPPQEFPWASSYNRGFDAWLRLLKAYTSR